MINSAAGPCFRENPKLASDGRVNAETYLDNILIHFIDAKHGEDPGTTTYRPSLSEHFAPKRDGDNIEYLLMVAPKDEKCDKRLTEIAMKWRNRESEVTEEVLSQVAASGDVRMFGRMLLKFNFNKLKISAL